MEPLYNYGISQEDVLSECEALKLADGESFLCIASAGEIPLNVAALKNVKIIAADVSANQIRLCRLKQAASLHCESADAAGFLGYMGMQDNMREEIFRDVLFQYLPEGDREFWLKNLNAVKGGAINNGRFEKYMLKVTGTGRFIVGEKNLYSLFECNSIEEQKEIFEKKINGPIVKGIFRIAFHPLIYKNRGIDPAGLIHSGARNIGEFFFNRFRSFCCNTLSRENYFLQYTFFNKVLFREALPEFLKPEYHETFAKNAGDIEYSENPVENILKDCEKGKFAKIHISNIGDWMTKESMAEIFSLISDKTMPGARVVMRYIHLNHKIPADVPGLIADYELGDNIALKDRYPFYSIVPIIRK
jgi:S-adenosylmethionine-diacylglycerol 3-amino-3-carboxypropyl transferase